MAFQIKFSEARECYKKQVDMARDLGVAKTTVSTWKSQGRLSEVASFKLVYRFPGRWSVNVDEM